MTANVVKELPTDDRRFAEVSNGFCRELLQCEPLR